jgi:plastocyanin
MLRFIRRMKYLSCLCVLGVVGPLQVGATDGQPILDLGIVSWLEYQKKQLLVEVTEITIHEHAIQSADVSVSIYQAVIFENQDEMSHRLVFLPDVDNLMETAYTSAVIRASERWGAEFHGFGVFPYHCTIHPEEHGQITVTL